MKRIVFLILVPALLVPLPGGAVPEDVSQTKHNLSVYGPGPLRATGEKEVCVFCHTPHNANPRVPLWNHSLSQVTNYTPYSSSTLNAVVGQPDGASKLCLSCHDGTVAVGLTGSRGVIQMIRTGAGGEIPPGPTNLTTDLSNTHPVSFVPDTAHDPEIRLPPPGDPIRLDEAQKVQCTSCHNPHKVEFPNFLVRDTTRGALCVTCHVMTGWMGSEHETSTAFYPPDQAVSRVADAACLACHTSHGAPGAQHLLRGASEADTCYLCHQPSPVGVAADVQTEFAKPSNHPVDLAGSVQQPVRTLNPRNAVLLDQKRSECADCHNSHRATDRNALEGVRGIRIDGSIAENTPGSVVQEYEICLRCHGDTYDRFIPPAPLRPPSGSNKRQEFSQASGSFHPVASTGRNTSVRLQAQLSRSGSNLDTFSKIKCTDCHNNERTADVQGPASRSRSGPKGPHGSFNAGLLRAAYNTQTGTLSSAPFAAYSSSNFALCYLCHDEQSFTSEIDFTGTNFGPKAEDQTKNLHALHLVTKDRASCHECHYNVHGTIESTNTDPPNAPHLISFAPSVQPLAPNPLPVWRPAGGTHGGAYCLVSCHGKSMNRDNDYLP